MNKYINIMKKMNIKSRLGFLFIIVFASCSNADLDQATELKSDSRSTTEISISEAIERAESLLDEIGSTTPATREVESIEIIGSAATRTDESPQAPLYLVNFSDNQGFAILGSDTRMMDIYAISDKGHLEMSDTIDNEPLAHFINTAIIDAENSMQSPTRSFGPIEYDYQYLISDKVEPMLHENVGLWHQREPYNKYCKIHLASYAPVGCGAIVIASLLSYYDFHARLPWVYNDGDIKFTIGWDALLENMIEDESNVDDLAKALAVLGKQEYLDAKYSLSNTEIDSKNFLPTLVKLGFANENLYYETPLKDNVKEVLNFMKRGSGNFPAAPLIFWGEKTPATGSPHFWVVDGYITRSAKVNTPSINPSSQTLFHCVWGQQPDSGYQNGYFCYVPATDSFDSKRANPTGGYPSTNPNTYKNILVIGGYHK